MSKMQHSDELVRKEIEVAAEWESIICEEHDPLTLHTPIENVDVHLIDQLLSGSECEGLLKAAEFYGFGVTNYPKDYRGNLRLTVDDSSLAKAVWKRLESVVPQSVEECGNKYEAVGLNERWRLAKYLPGDQFQQHEDAYFEDDSGGFLQGRKSMYTVNIYLNDGCTGGSTAFEFEEGQSPLVRTYDVVPKTGLCLLFRQPPAQHYLHEGKRVEGGLKYLLRSDVMYRLVRTKK